jgi:RHS repeat-associated protein
LILVIFLTNASPTHAYNYERPHANSRRIYHGNSALAFGATTNYTLDNVNDYTAISGSANPSYDDNGNMTSGPVPAGAALLNYDKENRLRSTVCNGVTTLYTYDALGRLLCVDQPNSNSDPTKEIYTWSSWTMLARAIYTSGSLTETFRYTWGLDLSGSLEGAGGVGGLLAIERNVTGSTTWEIRYAHNDANGNIIALTDSTGNVSARYRYDAFGNTLSATDVDNTGWVNHNIHRFSSKPSFGNTGLLFYGYRWYTPRDARWINRDPIEESGGMNLYGFVGNDGVDRWDLLGNNPAIVAVPAIEYGWALIAGALGIAVGEKIKEEPKEEIPVTMYPFIAYVLAKDLIVGADDVGAGDKIKVKEGDITIPIPKDICLPRPRKCKIIKGLVDDRALGFRCWYLCEDGTKWMGEGKNNPKDCDEEIDHPDDVPAPW